MGIALLRSLAVSLVLVVTAGCSGPETPQEVAEAFWQSVAENDVDSMAELSTLDKTKDFDGFDRDWTDVAPAFGRVVIDDVEATIVTRLPSEDGPDADPQELVTYLVRQQEGWQVDYRRTREAIMNPSPFGQLMGELGKLRDKLEASFASSSNDLEASMNEFASEFEAYTRDLEQQAKEAMEDFGESLQNAMEDLADSINEALEDNDQMPRDDKVLLEEAAVDLEGNSESLDDPSMDSLAEASRAMARTGERFSRLSEETFERYREDWNEALTEIRAETDSFFVDLRQRTQAGS
ncbi:apolipoprotein A1/A4/E family protein [Marinobacter sp. F4216]|uniref:apolipoprotein A1/A4/E family protein n=1 Tax=Marinobacter sp. F4216 TaxID=2874281 RepID=UPI001CBA906D|nr:apolipoprotein A1/A4/E family protein [Marinobacter sp. F4216]MBZ2169082.1 apolipoprotein A1/A4/E family protein [Marinobacter sp. F4216]